ncbi:MAG: serpin family protein [Clostridia bacterium]|nr:serpin family protein [Clostridia bacterium]
MKKLISLLLSLVLLLGTSSLLFGCEEKETVDTHVQTSLKNTEEKEDTDKNEESKNISSEEKENCEAENNSGDVNASHISVRNITESDKAYYYNFSADLFRKSQNASNTCVSPLSVYIALAMLTNGAEGNSLVQLEEALGMTGAELNTFIHSYMNTLEDSEAAKLKIANSIWFSDKNDFQVNESFLKTTSEYFNSDIFSASFDDTTLYDINKWVEDKTDGMIKDILNEISPYSVMFLINALTFDAEWEDKYFEGSTTEDIFNISDCEGEVCEFLEGSEGLYLEDENTTGFVKYYKGRNYAFVALLPDESISINEYIDSLSGEKIMNLLATMQNTNVNTRMPKFKKEFECDLAETLKTMGITDVFDTELADLSSLGTSPMGNIFVSRAIHKTFIEVDEGGTKAGAATILDLVCGSSPPQKTKSVNLDRPFVYMIIDCENNMPLFIGNVSSVN